MVVRIRGTLARLHDAVPRALGLFLLACAIAKLFKPITLCEDPFETANMLMIPVEFFCGILLWLPGAGRRRAALLVAFLMPGAAIYLAYMHHRGFDVRSCGCFGPVRLSFPTHLVVLAVLCAVSTAVFLREKRRQREDAEARDARSVHRLRRLFR